MTREELWSIYTTKNPKMAGSPDDQITLTVRGLKKLFDTTWERGHEAGVENGKAWEKAQADKVDKALGGLGKTGDIFSEIFGSKK